MNASYAKLLLNDAKSMQTYKYLVHNPAVSSSPQNDTKANRILPNAIFYYHANDLLIFTCTRSDFCIYRCTVYTKLCMAPTVPW